MNVQEDRNRLKCVASRGGAQDLFTRVGLLALIAASGWNYAAHRWLALTGSASDGFGGLLYGVAIGAMLLGIVRTRRKRMAS